MTMTDVLPAHHLGSGRPTAAKRRRPRAASADGTRTMPRTRAASPSEESHLTLRTGVAWLEQSAGHCPALERALEDFKRCHREELAAGKKNAPENGHKTGGPEPGRNKKQQQQSARQSQKQRSAAGMKETLREGVAWLEGNSTASVVGDSAPELKKALEDFKKSHGDLFGAKQASSDRGGRRPLAQQSRHGQDEARPNTGGGVSTTTKSGDNGNGRGRSKDVADRGRHRRSRSVDFQASATHSKMERHRRRNSDWRYTSDERGPGDRRGSEITGGESRTVDEKREALQRRNRQRQERVQWLKQQHPSFGDSPRSKKRVRDEENGSAKSSPQSLAKSCLKFDRHSRLSRSFNDVQPARRRRTIDDAREGAVPSSRPTRRSSWKDASDGVPARGRERDKGSSLPSPGANNPSYAQARQANDNEYRPSPRGSSPPQSKEGRRIESVATDMPNRRRSWNRPDTGDAHCAPRRSSDFARSCEDFSLYQPVGRADRCKEKAGNTQDSVDRKSLAGDQKMWRSFHDLCEEESLLSHDQGMQSTLPEARNGKATGLNSQGFDFEVASPTPQSKEDASNTLRVLAKELNECRIPPVWDGEKMPPPPRPNRHKKPPTNRGPEIRPAIERPATQIPLAKPRKERARRASLDAGKALDLAILLARSKEKENFNSVSKLREISVELRDRAEGKNATGDDEVACEADGVIDSRVEEVLQVVRGIQVKEDLVKNVGQQSGVNRRVEKVLKAVEQCRRRSSACDTDSGDGDDEMVTEALNAAGIQHSQVAGSDVESPVSPRRKKPPPPPPPPPPRQNACKTNETGQRTESAGSIQAETALLGIDLPSTKDRDLVSANVLSKEAAALMEKGKQRATDQGAGGAEPQAVPVPPQPPTKPSTMMSLHTQFKRNGDIVASVAVRPKLPSVVPPATIAFICDSQPRPSWLRTSTKNPPPPPPKRTGSSQDDSLNGTECKIAKDVPGPPPRQRSDSMAESKSSHDSANRKPKSRAKPAHTFSLNAPPPPPPRPQ